MVAGNLAPCRALIDENLALDREIHGIGEQSGEKAAVPGGQKAIPQIAAADLAEGAFRPLA